MKLKILVFILLYTSIKTAQQQIQFINEVDKNPISNIHYEYGSQKGISNKEGIISIKYSENDSLILSHIAYGKWKLNEMEILSSLNKGIYKVKENHYQLYPVTVIAIKNNVNKNNVTLDYEDNLEHDAAAILENENSISTIKKGGKYGYDIVIRGFKYDQINITLDGVQSATAACPNRMDPPSSQMSPNMLNNIEIIKGPYALRYGTGIGATLNFNSQISKFSDSLKVNGRFSSGYETNGNVKKGEFNLGLSHKKINLNVFGAIAEGDDYLSGNNTLIPADFYRTSWGVSLGTKLNKNNTFRVSATNNKAKDSDFAALTMDLINDNTWLLNAQHKLIFNSKKIQSLSTTVYTSIVDHLMSNELKDLNPRKLNATTNASTLNYGARTESKWFLNNSIAYLGADYKIEQASGIREREFLLGPNKGKTLYDNAWQESSIDKLGLFGEINHQKNKTKYTFSTRLELNNSAINTPDINFDNLYSKNNSQQFNPNYSLGMDHKIFTNSNFKIWIARAQRSGSLIERYINFFPVGLDPYELVGNPNLNTEKNNQIDLIYEWKKDKIHLTVDVYYSYLQDFIIGLIDTSLTPRITNSPGVRKFVNIDNAFKTGGDLNIKQYLNKHFIQEAGISYTYAQNITLDQPLSEIPPLAVKYKLKSLFLNEKLLPSITLFYTGAQNRVSYEYGESETPEYFKVDLNISYKFKNNLKFNGGINNVLNSNYYDHLSRYVNVLESPLYAPGRNYFFSINYLF